MLLNSNNANIKAVITADDKASGVLKNFADKTSGTSNRISSGLALAAKSLAIAGSASVAFGVASVKAFSESEDTIAQTNAVLKSTHQVAGVTADAVTHLATALQKETKFSDEQVRSAENLLLTFTAIGKDIFPQATKTVLDMATALGEDTKSASIQLGKALQDPILGITALRRVGVNFNESQKEVITKLVETGQKAKAQQLILKELNTEFGGSAKAAGDTLSGSLEKLKNKFNDLQEKIGGFIVQGLRPLADALVGGSDASSIAMLRFEQLKGATADLKKAHIEAKDAVQKVDHAQRDYNTSVAAFGPNSKPALKALAQLREAQLHDMQTKADAKFQQQLYNAAEDRFVQATPGIKKAIQDRARSLGLVVSQLGDGIRNARDLDKALSGIQPKAVSVSSIISGVKSGGLKINHRAAGGPVTSGSPYFVGEKGPELIVPSHSGNVIPNNKLSNSTASQINISINAGAFMGSDTEARKFAQIILMHMKDLGGKNNMSVAQLLGM